MGYFKRHKWFFREIQIRYVNKYIMSIRGEKRKQFANKHISGLLNPPPVKHCSLNEHNPILARFTCPANVYQPHWDALSASLS